MRITPAAPEIVVRKSGRPRTKDREPVGILAVEVALDVLNRIVAYGRGVALSELSCATSLQPSKLHRYLVSLCRAKMIVQSSVTGLYDLGPAARHVGAAAFNRYDSIRSVRDAMGRLATATGHAMFLYVWTELGPTLVHIEPGSMPMTVAIRIGSAVSLCGSGTGRVFLAYLPEETTQPFVEREQLLAKADGVPFWSAKELAAELGLIRSSRVYWSMKALIAGGLAVAPIFGDGGRIYCAISASAPVGYCGADRRKSLIAALAKAAGELTKELNAGTASA